MKLKLTERLTEAVGAFRVWLPTAPQQFRVLVDQAREDPKVLLRSPAVRVGALTSCGLILAAVIYGLGQWLAPSAGMGETAEQVAFRVRCVNPQCKLSRQPASIRMDVDFDDWPATCPECGKETLHPYIRCHNTKCRKWVVPRIREDGSRRCPKCGARL